MLVLVLVIVRVHSVCPCCATVQFQQSIGTHLLSLRDAFEKSPYMSLPELTNANGEVRCLRSQNRTFRIIQMSKAHGHPAPPGLPPTSQFCPGSCQAQAWSAGCVIDAMHDMGRACLGQTAL